MFKPGASFTALRILITILAFVMLGAGIALLNRPSGPKNELKTPSPSTPVYSLKPTSADLSDKNINVIYAVSGQESTQLLLHTGSDSNSTVVGLLPDRIKHINFISSSKIIFISDTDENDHGLYIKEYNPITSEYKILATAQNGWGIDDVIVSPDATYIAWWEVKMTAEDELLGGLSRVYARNIAQVNASPVLLTDETALETAPIHYPLFFDTSNRLYLDSYIPNGGGFYLGMYSTDPNAFNLSPIPTMQNGDYLSDPEVSPDGSRILFTAYDKNAPLQLSSFASSGVNRQENINPNQIVILDLQTKQKTVIRDSSGDAQYASPKWSNDGLSIAYIGLKVTGSDSVVFDGMFTIKLNETTPVKIPVNLGTTRFNLLSFVNNAIVWGKTTTEVGNLSPKYAQILSEVNASDISSGNTASLLSQPYIQYITANQQIIPGQKFTSDALKSVQLATFVPKVVPQKRKDQQNNPKPKPTQFPFPSEGLRSFPTVDPSRENLPKCRDYCNIPEPTPLPGSCYGADKCYDSPLYLYPEKETQITVKTEGAAIFSDSPQREDNTWKVKAYPNGHLYVNDKQYRNINYSYFGNPQPPPKYGLVTQKGKLDETLQYVAGKLNLQGIEVQDFISFWKETVPFSPYYLISFYPPESLTKILRYEFNPKPDTFLQIIMYFKPLEGPISIPPPTFTPKERKGFVAVDWSGIIDQ